VRVLVRLAADHQHGPQDVEHSGGLAARQYQRGTSAMGIGMSVSVGVGVALVGLVRRTPHAIVAELDDGVK
jgi:hypothetical protein